MATAGGKALPVAPLVLDEIGSLEGLADAVMRLHSTLLTTGRVYTTDASGNRSELERGRHNPLPKIAPMQLRIIV